MERAAVARREVAVPEVPEAEVVEDLVEVAQEEQEEQEEQVALLPLQQPDRRRGFVSVHFLQVQVQHFHLVI